MSTYLIDMTGKSGITFAPSSAVEEILQNVRTIITTRVGTVPLDRDFGLSIDMLDKPVTLAYTLFQSALIQALAVYEPRAKVTKIDFSTDADSVVQGITTPKITLEIEE